MVLGTRPSRRRYLPCRLRCYLCTLLITRKLTRPIAVTTTGFGYLTKRTQRSHLCLDPLSSQSAQRHSTTTNFKQWLRTQYTLRTTSCAIWLPSFDHHGHADLRSPQLPILPSGKWQVSSITLPVLMTSSLKLDFGSYVDWGAQAHSLALDSFRAE